MIRSTVCILLCMAAFLGGCTSDGRVREIDGMYRKVYPDKKQGGWYYVDGHGDKIHLDRLPPERDIFDLDKQETPGLP